LKRRGLCAVLVCLIMLTMISISPELRPHYRARVSSCLT